MIHSAPKIMSLPTDLHENLIQVPLPLRTLAASLPTGAFADLMCAKYVAKPVDPEPDAFMADIDPAFVKKVFDIPQ
jgi:hypothetical protein